MGESVFFPMIAFKHFYPALKGVAMTAVSVVLHRGLGRSCTLLTVTPIDGEFESAITEFRNWAQQSYAGAPR